MAHMGHPYEWQKSSASLMGTAVNEKAKADQANALSTSDIRSTSSLSMHAAAASSQALSSWTATNDTLTNKMEAERGAVQQEIADLTAERAAAAAFAEAFRPGLSACEKCHAIRAQRPKRELILDSAAIALRDQHTDCHQSLELLAQVGAACGNELTRLGVMLDDLTKAIDLKRAHLQVDDACITGAVTPGQAPPATSRSSLLPYRWKQDAEETVTKSMNVRAVCERVRAKSAKVQKDVRYKQTEFRNLCANTLSKKLSEAQGLCAGLKTKLDATSAEIDAVQSSLSDTTTALDAKADPLGLAEGRLAERLKRPASERVRDEVERALEAEVSDLTSAMNQLNADINRGTAHFQRLQRVQAELQADVADKEATIALDTDALNTQKAIVIV
jgi:hypothetical protein